MGFFLTQNGAKVYQSEVVLYSAVPKQSELKDQLGTKLSAAQRSAIPYPRANNFFKATFWQPSEQNFVADVEICNLWLLGLLSKNS